MSIVQCVVLSPNYSDSVLTFVYVGMQLSVDDGESFRAFDPVVTDFTEKACVVNSSEVLLEYHVILDLLKPLPQNFN